MVDCPHRERLGYGGDAGTSLETGMFNFATGGFTASGPRTGGLRRTRRPATCPTRPPTTRTRGRRADVERLPRHASLAALSPVRRPADPRGLVSQHPEVARFRGVEDRRSRARVLPELRDEDARVELPRRLGEPAASGQEDPARGPLTAPLINNCHYLYTLQLAAKMATVLGKTDDAATVREKGGRCCACAARAVLRAGHPQLRGRRPAVPGVSALGEHRSARSSSRGDAEPGADDPGEELRPHRRRNARAPISCSST